MNRIENIKSISNKDKVWDFIIIGGGATGVGTAVEAASRGYSCLLVEQSDFGKGTSSRSTKLIHGGVRYLQQGNISLVKEALKERAILKKNAPHIVHDLPFIVPIYSWWEGPFYGIGLKLYDILAGKEGFGSSESLSKEETIDFIPNVEQDGLIGGVKYYDGQFNDSRLLINLAQTASEQGATLLNYMKVDSLLSDNNVLNGAVLIDQETNEKYEVKGKVIVNATGVFTDSIRKMDDSKVKPIMTSSQGIHLVFDKKFLKKETALMIPTTDDGRVLFVVPWENQLIIGTTDTFTDKYILEPKALQEEIDYLLEHIARYLEVDPTRDDIKSVYVGLRPLVKSGNGEDTSEISREHVINLSDSGLVTITGGKWTTYRKMAEDTVDTCIAIANLKEEKSVTENLQIHGFHRHSEQFGRFKNYGADAPALLSLCQSTPDYEQLLSDDFNLSKGEVIWFIKNEYARTIDDVLSRRSRCLFLNVDAAIDMTPKIAEIIAAELGYNSDWIDAEIKRFLAIAENYETFKK